MPARCTHGGCARTFIIERIPNLADNPVVLLTRAWRERPRIGEKTIANLFMFPDHVVVRLRTVLRGGFAMTGERSSRVVAVPGICRLFTVRGMAKDPRSRRRHRRSA